MKIDFQYDGIRYMLNFDDVDCKDHENGLKAVEVRVYHSLEPDSLYGSSIKQIKDNGLLWGMWDYSYVPKEAQAYIDRMISLLAFS